MSYPFPARLEGNVIKLKDPPSPSKGDRLSNMLFNNVAQKFLFNPFWVMSCLSYLSEGAAPSLNICPLQGLYLIDAESVGYIWSGQRPGI